MLLEDEEGVLLETQRGALVGLCVLAKNVRDPATRHDDEPEAALAASIRFG